MALFDLNPTFTPLKTPFGSSMALFMDCYGVDCGSTMDRPWIDCGLTMVAYGVDHGVDGPLNADLVPIRTFN